MGNLRIKYEFGIWPEKEALRGNIMEHLILGWELKRWTVRHSQAGAYAARYPGC